MKLSHILSATALISTALLANPYETKDEELISVIKTGNEASAALLKTLGGSLKKHMQSEGAMGAVKFCSTNAYPLTDSINTELGENVSIKRISLKYRNPANRPTENEAKVLTSLETLKSSGVMLPPYMIEQVDKETYKYYKPLAINKGVCLKCHGDMSDTPKLAEFIQKNYPEDKAVGYKMGDLRGAIVVTVKK